MSYEYEKTLKHCVRQLNEYDSKPHDIEVQLIHREIEKVYTKAKQLDELISLHKQTIPQETRREVTENYIISFMIHQERLF